MSNDIEPPVLRFPPYGIMNNEFLKNLNGGEPLVPPDFQCGPVKGQCEDQWINLRDDTMRRIADALWPVWNPESSAWEGAAAERMLDLTRADLALLLQIRTGRPAKLPLDSVPSAKPRALNCPPHSFFFREEDPGKIFNSYAFYDRTLDAKFPPIFADAFFAGLAAKCSSASLQYKRRLQRPRPFQMAFLTGKMNFNLEEAISSMTPSMVSGHSLQGMLGAGAVMEQIVEGGIPFSDDSWQALLQYAVDIGDRRVMAGVHYPSDNIASWIVTMVLANRVYRVKDIKNILWQAIDQQSFVYDLIRDSGFDVYKPALELLRLASETN